MEYVACVGTLAIVHHDTKQPFHCKQVCMSKALLQVRNREQLVLKAAGCTASYYRQVASILLVTDMTSSSVRKKGSALGLNIITVVSDSFTPVFGDIDRYL